MELKTYRNTYANTLHWHMNLKSMSKLTVVLRLYTKFWWDLFALGWRWVLLRNTNFMIYHHYLFTYIKPMLYCVLQSSYTCTIQPQTEKNQSICIQQCAVVSWRILLPSSFTSVRLIYAPTVCRQDSVDLTLDQTLSIMN